MPGTTSPFSIEELRQLKAKIEGDDPWQALEAIKIVLETMFGPSVKDS